MPDHHSRRRQRNVAHAVAIACSIVAAACLDTSSPPIPHSPFLADIQTGDRANEPTGFASVLEYAFDDDLPTSGAVSGGWSIANDSGLASRDTTSGAPISPVNVGLWKFPSGFKGGAAPATLDHPLDTLRDVYVGLWWKPSSPWQSHPSGINTIAYVRNDSSGDMVTWQMHAIAADTFRMTVELQLQGVSNPTFNVMGSTAVDVTLGVWHHLELRLKMSTTSTSADGIVAWWLDGTGIGCDSTVNFNVASPFTSFAIHPSWGGVDGQKTEDDYYWFDHVYISAPSTAWPNAPSWPLISDQPFTNSNTLGWQVIWNHPDTLCTPTNPPTLDGSDRVDAGAPFSPSGVWQVMYPCNFVGGDAPATEDYELGGNVRHLYAGLWWKVSSPWQGHTSDVNKIAFVTTDSSQGDIALEFYGPPGGPYPLHVVTQIPGLDERRLPPNVQDVDLTVGQWHRLEWLIDYDAHRIAWWLDGVLVGDYRDVAFPTAGLAQYLISPTWGGVGDQKTETDYYWFDHALLKGN